MKKCFSCEEVKPFDQFHKQKAKNDGLQSYCKQCYVIKLREYKAKDPEKVKNRSRRNHMRRKYDLSVDGFHSLWDSQCGNCAICSSSLNFGTGGFAIDHNHSTGKVRGILCGPCNLGIGHLKDNPDILKSAATYLESRGFYGPKPI